MTNKNHTIKLGLGLIGIGREWGHVKSAIPNEAEVRDFLEYAHSIGVDFFDTAPAYGTSEERLGRFLASISPTDRQRVTVATKVGEKWNAEYCISTVDHSYDGLRQSLERSLEHLGAVDLVQLHKSSTASLASDAFARFCDYAKSIGVRTIGASVSDYDTALHACYNARIDTIQLPYNSSNTIFSNIIDQISSCEKLTIINRPFNMGKLLAENPNSLTPSDQMVAAFKFILSRRFNGVVLTGTKSKLHLLQNIECFKLATAHVCETDEV